MAEPNDTRGMSLRELVLEMRLDLKDQNRRIARRPTRAELYGTAGLASGVIFGLVKLL